MKSDKNVIIRMLEYMNFQFIWKYMFFFMKIKLSHQAKKYPIPNHNTDHGSQRYKIERILIIIVNTNVPIKIWTLCLTAQIHQSREKLKFDRILNMRKPVPQMLISHDKRNFSQKRTVAISGPRAISRALKLNVRTEK